MFADDIGRVKIVVTKIDEFPVPTLNPKERKRSIVLREHSKLRFQFVKARSCLEESSAVEWSVRAKKKVPVSMLTCVGSTFEQLVISQ